MRPDALVLAPTLAAASDPRWPALDPLADLVNPALGLVLLVLVARAARGGRTREALGLPITLAIMLALAYGIAYIDRALGLAALFGLDFSTHSAVHLAAWTTLLIWHPRAWPLAALVAMAYHAFMVAQTYHSLADLLVTVATVGLLFTVLGTMLRPATRPRADSGAARQNGGH